MEIEKESNLTMQGLKVPNASEQFINFDVVEIRAVHATMSSPVDAIEDIMKYKGADGIGYPFTAGV